jgi:hypothetical protein
VLPQGAILLCFQKFENKNSGGVGEETVTDFSLDGGSDGTVFRGYFRFSIGVLARGYLAKFMIGFIIGYRSDISDYRRRLDTD